MLVDYSPLPNEITVRRVRHYVRILLAKERLDGSKKADNIHYPDSLLRGKMELLDGVDGLLEAAAMKHGHMLRLATIIAGFYGRGGDGRSRHWHKPFLMLRGRRFPPRVERGGMLPSLWRRPGFDPGRSLLRRENNVMDYPGPPETDWVVATAMAARARRGTSFIIGTERNDPNGATAF